eukprot:TRINITY_DN15952_c0_g1_i1.p1 TRINITY_DN15952_c0_g1~~TRINITY_DN15952_c0_g1_i1.p1  ORF type:complete len:177 (+),score=33.28 TRINITY_DN15952_c0_g1_i1:112-642(+)
MDLSKSDAYLKSHNIHGLLESLAESVMKKKPNDVYKFLESELDKQVRDENEISTKNWVVVKATVDCEQLQTVDDNNVKMKLGVSNKVVKLFFPGDLFVDEPDDDGLSSRLATDMSFGIDTPVVPLSLNKDNLTRTTLTDSTVALETSTNLKINLTFASKWSASECYETLAAIIASN